MKNKTKEIVGLSLPSHLKLKPLTSPLSMRFLASIMINFTFLRIPGFTTRIHKRINKWRDMYFNYKVDNFVSFTC